MTSRPSKSCAQCGASLDGTRKHKFCSRKCQRKSVSPIGEDRQCANCGEGFKARHPAQRYCKSRCRYLVDLRSKLMYPNGYKQKHVCRVCKVAYTATDHRSLYCTERCKQRQWEINRGPRRFRAWRFNREELEPAPVIERVKETKPEPIPAADLVVYDDDGPLHDGKPTGYMHGKGFEFSGFSESAPRQATTTVTGCPTCRASGKDYQGNIRHSSWCQEADIA